MNAKELKAARRLINKVRAKPGIGSDQRDQLRKAGRQLDKIARSGKLDGRRFLWAIHAVANVLSEIVDSEDVGR
jgi:hypothetical protein